MSLFVSARLRKFLIVRFSWIAPPTLENSSKAASTRRSATVLDSRQILWLLANNRDCAHVPRGWKFDRKGVEFSPLTGAIGASVHKVHSYPRGFPVCCRLLSDASIPSDTMPRDEFAEIARQLQEAVSELQETLNHEKRLTLLGHMRLLLLEADRVLDDLKPPSPM